jgi:predicted nucleotide-binding protein
MLKEAQRTLREDLADHEYAAITVSPDVSDDGQKALSRKVFIVHGHDEGAREMVARFLERLGFQSIILHEQANQGRTVMEKVEAHGDVSFAVVLLTPDDEGCAKGGTPEPRARQNVLLELGYFLGRLGRDKVCALKRGTVEIPSDFAGVVWESMDSTGWKQALGRELEAVGHEIDWNKVMRA